MGWTLDASASRLRLTRTRSGAVEGGPRRCSCCSPFGTTPPPSIDGCECWCKGRSNVEVMFVCLVEELWCLNELGIRVKARVESRARVL